MAISFATVPFKDGFIIAWPKAFSWRIVDAIAPFHRP